MVRLFWTSPRPRQVGQGFSTILPLPPHLSQGAWLTNCPKIVFCRVVIVPAPLHFVQVIGLVPGRAPGPAQGPHSSVTGRRGSFVVANGRASAGDPRVFRGLSTRTVPPRF